MPQRRLVENDRELIVACCRNDPADTPAHDPFAALSRELAGRGITVHYVGQRPGKEIDPFLVGTVLVVGDDADLAAVALRLLRRDLLEDTILGFVSPGPTAFTRLWGLPIGPDAIELSTATHEIPATLVRDDVGGVLVGAAEVAPVDGTVYVDERRVVHGSVKRIRVQPEATQGLTLSVEQRRLFGLGHSVQRFTGRAASFGATGMHVVSDGIPRLRPMDRWTFYKHTAPLRLLVP